MTGANLSLTQTCRGNEWEAGNVVKTHYREPSWPASKPSAPYQVESNSHNTTEIIPSKPVSWYGNDELSSLIAEMGVCPVRRRGTEEGACE